MTKDYLRQYQKLCGQVARYGERIEQIEGSLQKSINLDGLPHGTGTSDPTQQTAIRLAEIRTKLKEALLEAELMKQTIANEIEEVDNPRYRELLYSRYILCLTWEKVADRVSIGRKKEYEVTHVKGWMHSEALKAFEKARNRSTSNNSEDEM